MIRIKSILIFKVFKIMIIKIVLSNRRTDIENRVVAREGRSRDSLRAWH